MKIRIVSVGKLKQAYLSEGVRDYVRRLKPYATVELVNVADEPVPERGGPAVYDQVKQREGERLLKRVPHSSFLIALDEAGTQMTSEEFAMYLKDLAAAGIGDVTFAIGGTLGLTSQVLEVARLRLSLSRMTFTHQLVPLILLEQIYRAMKINAGETYHR